ncbi:MULTISPECIES: hypothetical protein [Phenylobacterium]|uniref:Cell envelope biogenesis protein TolA n=1 Tax=Phenylobacterium koreense TaxID=266125 RepID=A0ABV2EJM1_9CAUL
MAPRLKVFVTSDGLTDYVVAVSSRAKALEAWGAHQDLFQTGGARQTEDPELVEAACASPGTVLRRPTGATPPKAAAKPKSKPAAKPEPPRPARPKAPSPAAVRKVKDLEARLVDMAAAHGEALDEIAAQRAALDARREALETDYLAKRERLREALRKAREALRR